jgi:hypothetical protein
MNAARPITPDEYKKFREELYKPNTELGRENVAYTVPLDEDPTLNPKGMPQKLALTQAYKDRVITILNRAISAEAYEKTVLAKVDVYFEAAEREAMISDEIKAAKSAEVRAAMAAVAAGKKVVEKAFKGEGTFDTHRFNLVVRHNDAISFLKEVQNIYDNLESTGVQLAVQLKSIMVSAKVFAGDGPELVEAGARR